MGRGSSKAGGGGGGGASGKKTPSGITYDQFMKMSDDEKYNTMDQILNDTSIVVPDILDGSDTSKIMYALGIDQKPTVVDDTTLDSMPGKELFRTVYEDGSMPPPSANAIIDQIQNGDFTQMSGKGGSAHGRALYFATVFGDSTIYGSGEKNAIVMRSKINPNANIRSEGSLRRQMLMDDTFDNSKLNSRLNGTDAIAAYAISQGIDGWYSGTYTMMVNRGVLTTSKTKKSISKSKHLKDGYNRDDARSWGEAITI